MGKVITVREAADRLVLCDKTVYGMVADGTVPGYKFKGAVRVDEDGLEAYIESRRIRPAPVTKPSDKPGRPKGSTHGKRRDPRWYDAPESEVYTGLSCLSRFRT